MAKYNRYAKRRTVRHTHTTEQGVAVAVTKSFTRDEVEHKPEVNLETGTCSCTCEHFVYRLAAKGSHVDAPETQCKHIARFAANLDRKGELYGGLRRADLQAEVAAVAPAYVPSNPDSVIERVKAQLERLKGFQPEAVSI
jgi:hypothetical protein